MKKAIEDFAVVLLENFDLDITSDEFHDGNSDAGAPLSAGANNGNTS